YWFDYGNVRFISYPEPYSSASQTWFDWNTNADTLMNEAQADPAIGFIVTFGHRPAYSSGGAADPTLKGYLDALGDTYNKYVLNLNGHDHDYERSFPQHGVVHVDVGTGGAGMGWGNIPCKWPACPQPSWSAKRYIRHGVERLIF